MIARFLSLFLSYVMLVTSIPITNMAIAATAQETCEATPGKIWDTRTNQCKEDPTITRISGDALSCADSADPNCYTGNAIDQVKDKDIIGDIPDSRGDKKNNFGAGMISRAIPMAISMLSTAYMIDKGTSGRSKATATSELLMIMAGVGIGIGEISAYMTYNMKLKKLVNKYKKNIKDNATGDKNTTDNTPGNEDTGSLIENKQIEAYEFLAQQEDLRKKAANIRFSFYTIGAAAYAAAMTVAILEAVGKSGADNNNYDLFTPREQDTTKVLYSSIHENKKQDFINYLIDKEINNIFNVNQKEILKLNPSELVELMIKKTFNNIIPSAIADDYIDVNESKDTNGWDIAKSFVTLVVGTAAVSAVYMSLRSTEVNLFDGLIGSATGRAALSGVLMGYSTVMAGFNRKDAKVADERAAAIRELKKKLSLSTSIHTDRCESRDDITKPVCYCYLASGEQNQQRRNSNTCKVIWGKAPNLKAGSYDPQDYETQDSPVCATATTVDVNCGCRQTNTCHRVQANFSLPSLGGASFINEPANALNSLYSGNTSAGSLDSRNLDNMAMRMKNNKDKVFSHPMFVKIAKQVKDGEAKLQTRFENDVIKALSTPQGQQALANFAPNNNAGVAAAPRPEEVLEKAKEAITTAPTSIATGGDKKQGDLFDLDLGNGNGGNAINIDEEVAKTMDQNYEIKGDIHSNSSHNIFNILTLRYQRSALPRFFDKEKKVELDKGNKSDITGK